jgi:hypothetical protein
MSHGQRLKRAFGLSLPRIRALGFMLLKTVLPYYILTEILIQTGWLEQISRYTAPFMQYWNLPGEASAVIVVGAFTSMYAAAAVLAPLGLSGAEITVLGFMVTIAHSLPMEGAVVRELLPGSFWYISIFRLVLALVSGWVLAQVLL